MVEVGKLVARLTRYLAGCQQSNTPSGEPDRGAAGRGHRLSLRFRQPRPHFGTSRLQSGVCRDRSVLRPDVQVSGSRNLTGCSIILLLLVGCGFPAEPPTSGREQSVAPAITGTAFFTASAESGTVIPPFPSWGVYYHGGALQPVASTARPKVGSRSYKFEILGNTACQSSAYCASTVSSPTRPTVSMGAPSGHWTTGWYSMWLYIDTGFTSGGWNVFFNLVGGAPDRSMTDPIGHIGIETSSINGILQFNYYPKNLEPPTRRYTPPVIPGYIYDHYAYWTTASSPAGVVRLPKGQWVHVSIYIRSAKNPNGQIQIWQNGVKVMNLTGLNTLDGFSHYNNVPGDFLFGIGLYESPMRPETRRIYVDDFKVTNYRVVP